MDILIKNIEKPKNCLECQFYLSEYDYCHALKDNLSQKEWETKSRCPLVELPPYSVLKDTGAIIENMEKAFSELFPIDGKHRQTIVSECHKAFLKAVLDAPTIVEASTEGEEKI